MPGFFLVHFYVRSLEQLLQKNTTAFINYEIIFYEKKTIISEPFSAAKCFVSAQLERLQTLRLTLFHITESD